MYTSAEYEAIAERFGGHDSIGIEVDPSVGPTGPRVRLTLVRSDAGAPASRMA